MQTRWRNNVLKFLFLVEQGRTKRVLGYGLAGLLFCGCALRPDRHEDDEFSDAQWAFDKDENELTVLERHCLEAARGYCDDLTPCCEAISVPIERKLCINLAADKCFGMSYDGAELSADGREICLERAKTLLDGCGPQTPPIQMPIDLRHDLRCEDQWPSTIVIPEAADADEPCGDADGLSSTPNTPCKDGLYCHREFGSEENDPRFCRPQVSAGETCSYGNECVTGTVCNDSVCMPLLELGETCEYSAFCESGACCDDECVEAPAVDAHLCWIYTYPGKSVPSALRGGNICDSIEFNERGRAGEDVLFD